MSRRDRAACVLAYEWCRTWHRPDEAVDAVGAVLDVLLLGCVTCDNITDAIPTLRSRDTRVARARLALLLRVLLRADVEDFGPTAWHGCHCACDGENGGLLPARYTPAWERAPAHVATVSVRQRREAGR